MNITQEFGHPHILLQNQEGILNSMVEQTGTSSAAMLRKTAKEV
jgi:hypothetical protein